MIRTAIYLDNAATSFPKPESVYRAVDDFQRHVGANPGRSGHAAARTAGKIVAEARLLLSRLFGVEEPNQIVFTANATEAINLGLKGLLRPGDHVVTTVTDHNSVLRPLRALEDTCSVEVSRILWATHRQEQGEQLAPGRLWLTRNARRQMNVSASFASDPDELRTPGFFAPLLDQSLLIFTVHVLS